MIYYPYINKDRACLYTSGDIVWVYPRRHLELQF